MSCCGNYVVPGAAPSGQDVTVSAGFGIVVTEPSPGQYIVASTGETLDQTTLVLFTVPNGTAIQSGGSPHVFGAVPAIGPFDTVKNVNVEFELIMSGQGTFTPNNNVLTIGIFRTSNNSEVATFDTPFGLLTPFDWGNSIPNGLNKLVSNVSVPYAVATGGLFYGAFIRFPGSGGSFDNLTFLLTVKYFV
jgi:hypothetical protein